MLAMSDTEIVEMYKRAHVLRIAAVNEQIKMNEQDLEGNPNAPAWVRTAIQQSIPQLKMQLREYTLEYDECIANNDVKRMRCLLDNPYYEKLLNQ